MMSFYQKLDPAQRQIRLLRVLGEESLEGQLRCEIQARSLDEEPEYTALSYTWGSSDKDKVIRVNDIETRITTSLFLALQSFRAQGDACHIWADAICIDQGNHDEVSSQVSMMGSIYSTAARTIIWLGPSADSSDLAMEAVAGIDAADLEQPLFGEKAEGWTAIQKLFRRPWWRRAWIVQEAFLSKDPVVRCGGVEVPMGRFVDFYNIWGARFSSSTMNDAYIPFSAVPFANCLASWAMTRRRLASAGSVGSLFHAITLVSRFDATVAVDKAFCVLGMADAADRAAVVPGYKRQEREVWIDVATRACHTEGLRTLGWVLPRTARNSDFPSWVPDMVPGTPHSYLVLNSVWYAACIDPVDPAWDELAARSITALGEKGRTLVSEVDRAKEELALYGVLLPDRVAFASPSPYIPIYQGADRQEQDKVRFARGEATIQAILGWEAAALSPSVPDVYAQSPGGREEAFWRTLMCDRCWGDKGRPTASEGGFDGARRLRALLRREAPPGFETPLEAPLRNDWVREYSSLAVYNSLNRAFVVTETGRFGLVIQGVEVGDQVFIARGGSTPYVVREISGGGYRFVGEAYIHGIMDGEAVTAAVQEGMGLAKVVLK